MNTSISTLQKEYETTCHEFQEAKKRFSEIIEFEDFDRLSSYDLMILQELQQKKGILFWKIKCSEINAELDTIKKAHPDHDYPRKYYELSARKWECWDNQLQLEKTEWEYNRHHKPVIHKKLQTLRSMMRRCTA